MNATPDPAPLPSSPRHPDRYERLFVLAVWAALSAALLGYVLRYGSVVPWMDDWDLVPALSLARKATLQWLWVPHNEHRLPVTKLVLMGVGAVSGGDFRAGMLASAILLSAAALAAIRAAARLRGRASYADAVFPLALLHPGHEQNVLGAIQLLFVSACTLAVAITILMADGRWRTSAGHAVGLAGCLLLLPLHGAVGVLLAPPLAAWMLYAAYERRREAGAGPRRAARVLAAGGLGALMLTAVYFIGFTRPPAHPTSPSMAASVRGASEVLAVTLGPFGAATWPWSAAALALVCLATLALLLAALRVHPHERSRVLSLLVAMGAVLGLLAAVGTGRAGFGPGFGFESRYALFGASLLPAVYLGWLLYGGAAARLFHVALFATLCAAYSVNVRHALDYARTRRAQADALLTDVRAGVPAEVVATRHWRYFYIDPELMGRRLRTLQKAGLGPYRGLPPPGSPVRCRDWEPVLPRQIGGQNMRWQDGVGRPYGPDPYVIFGLVDPERVCAVRVTLVHSAAEGRDASLKVYWARTAAGWFGEDRHWTTRIPSSPQPQGVVVWINDEIDLVRLDPDDTTEVFRVTGLELLAGS